MKHCIYIAAIAIAGIFMASCNKDANTPDPDTLVKINKTLLTKHDLKLAMPGGLSADDSTKYARAYIKNWIEAQLVRQFASKEINMSDIDKMVEQYRNELIMFEYTRQMFDSRENKIPEDTLMAYYDTHKEEFVLSRPMIKGIYIKVPSDASNIASLRKLYRSEKENDIDLLDKKQLEGAVHYDYFRDKWIDWEQIESRIPYDFGTSADNFLKQNKNIDTSQGGFTYLLDINDVLFTGQTMPYEVARNMINDRLTFRARKQYEETLKQNLFDNAKEMGKISIFCEL